MQDFIKARKNKDNFWNLVFWFGMSAGLTIGWFLTFNLSNKSYGTAFCWITILSIPIILKIANNTRFNQTERFVNSEGIPLNDRLPNGMFIVWTVVSCLFTGFLMDNFWHRPNNTFGAFLFFTGIFSGISIYFIFKNCPISILFNLKLWTMTGSGSEAYHRSHHFNSSNYPSYKASDTATNPRYSSLDTNIFHSPKRDHFR